MKRLITILLTALALTVSAQDEDKTNLKIYVGADFDTYFDNNESKGCDIDCSGTLFFSRLRPYLGLEWPQRHRLTFGVNVRQDFGGSESFVSDVKPLLYYSYQGGLWEAHAGVFTRNHLQGEYTDLTFDGGYAMDKDRVQGMAGTWKGRKGTWEGGISWDGLYSEWTREQFRIFSAGRYDACNHFHIGYDGMLTHLALSDRRDRPDEGVVDYFVFDPYVGTEFKAYFDWRIRAHAVVGYQRDRIVNDKKFPVGGQLDIAISKWGFTFHNDIYLGQNQLPFFDKYGDLLYAANEFYGTRHHIYNHTCLDYKGTFCDGMIEVLAQFEASYEGSKVALMQVALLRLNIEKIWKIK